MEREKATAILKKITGFLSRHPHVKTIYVNPNGDYHLHPVPGFQKMDVTDVLEYAEEDAPPPPPVAPVVETVEMPGESEGKQPEATNDEQNNTGENIQF